MSYTDKIECPHCHEAIKVEVEIDYGGYDDTYAIITPLPDKAKAEDTAESQKGELNAVNMER